VRPLSGPCAGRFQGRNVKSLADGLKTGKTRYASVAAGVVGGIKVPDKKLGALSCGDRNDPFWNGHTLAAVVPRQGTWACIA